MIDPCWRFELTLSVVALEKMNVPLKGIKGVDVLIAGSKEDTMREGMN